MGVTVLCRKTGRSIDLGYFGFKRLRDKVAELYGWKCQEMCSRETPKI